MSTNKSKIWPLGHWIVGTLLALIAIYVLTYSLDLDSPVHWEIRCAVSILLSGFSVFSLYVLHRAIQISVWYGVVALVLIVLLSFLAIRMVNGFIEASIPDLGTANLYLRMPIAVTAGLFGGMGSLLLARAFWGRVRSATNLIATGYFSITGLALVLGYLLIDVLTGFIRLVSISL